MMGMVLVALSLTATQYRDQLINESIQILRENKECTVYGFNKLYQNFSILSMVDDNFDRYDAVVTLRERCAGMKSKWEVK